MLPKLCLVLRIPSKNTCFQLIQSIVTNNFSNLLLHFIGNIVFSLLFIFRDYISVISLEIANCI
jgi:hypothetical protein